jgi:hypothetical protein
MIRYQVVLECDYCHDILIDDFGENRSFDPVEVGWVEATEEKPWKQFCCEGHMTAYLDANEKQPRTDG